MTNLQDASLRPVDLARPHGLSTQAVRNYEDDGILPAAERTSSGYRKYRRRHALALAAFLALAPACGHSRAASLLRALNTGRTDDAFALLDEAHGELAQDRATLAEVRAALSGLAGAIEPQAPAQRLFIGELAHQLGVVPATVRTWERCGIVAPHRDRSTGYRVFSPADVRDARMALQLRRGGFGLDQIASLTAHVRDAGGIEPLRDVLTGWQAAITRRGRALIAGAAEIDRLLAESTD